MQPMYPKAAMLWLGKRFLLRDRSVDFIERHQSNCGHFDTLERLRRASCSRNLTWSTSLLTLENRSLMPKDGAYGSRATSSPSSPSPLGGRSLVGMWVLGLFLWMGRPPFAFLLLRGGVWGWFGFNLSFFEVVGEAASTTSSLALSTLLGGGRFARAFFRERLSWATDEMPCHRH